MLDGKIVLNFIVRLQLYLDLSNQLLRKQLYLYFPTPLYFRWGFATAQNTHASQNWKIILRSWSCKVRTMRFGHPEQPAHSHITQSGYSLNMNKIIFTHSTTSNPIALNSKIFPELYKSRAKMVSALEWPVVGIANWQGMYALKSAAMPGSEDMLCDWKCTSRWKTLVFSTSNEDAV